MEGSFCLLLKNKAIGDCADDLVVKWMTYCSSRGPEFGFQQTPWAAHNCL